MTNTTTLTTVTMTPFAGHVRTLIWGSCAVARTSLMHIPRIVPGGDTACEPVVTCPCCGVEPCGANADCGMCRDDAAALGVPTTTAERLAVITFSPWAVFEARYMSFKSARSGQGPWSAGGSTPCEDACSICGGPNTAAVDGEGWCNGCDEDARLGGGEG